MFDHGHYISCRTSSGIQWKDERITSLLTKSLLLHVCGGSAKVEEVYVLLEMNIPLSRYGSWRDEVKMQTWTRLILMIRLGINVKVASLRSRTATTFVDL